MGSNPSHFTFFRLPVESVSWNDCQTFLKELNSLSKVKFRLPSEAEWEYACRAGSDAEYCFGDNATNLDAYACFDAWSTDWVGEREANAWGLHDMYGNVWEWCQDWYGPYQADAVADPNGPSECWLRAKVVRGGGYMSPQGECRSAVRSHGGVDERYRCVGFRIASSALRQAPIPSPH